MNERHSASVVEETLFVRLMNKLTGRDSVAPHVKETMAMPSATSMTIVEVTEELLKQTRK